MLSIINQAINSIEHRLPTILHLITTLQMAFTIETPMSQKDSILTLPEYPTPVASRTPISSLTSKMINTKISSGSLISNKTLNYKLESQGKTKMISNIIHPLSKYKSINSSKITPSKNHPSIQISTKMTLITTKVIHTNLQKHLSTITIIHTLLTLIKMKKLITITKIPNI